MEKRLKCVMMLSLKEMVLRRLVVLLSNDCLVSSPSHCDTPESRFLWHLYGVDSSVKEEEIWGWLNTFEDNVKYKISKLLLPGLLRKEMIDKVRPISLEIRKWAVILREVLGDSVEVGFAKFHWTTAGTMDYKKTAEALIGCEVLDIEKRYKLASFYCLEDYIPILREELDEDRKYCFLRRISVSPNLEECWPRILKDQISELDCLWKTSDRNLTSLNQWAFEDSARKRNKTAAEYFFRKLTHEEREASLMRTTLAELSNPPPFNCVLSFYDVICYLLSLMTPEQQMETIREHPVHVMLCFYVMFWQDLLVENAGLIWSSVPSSCYGGLAKKIFLIGYPGRYYPKSFREFFTTSPLDFKKHLVYPRGLLDIPPVCHFLREYLNDEDSESIECIFRNLDAADRAAIVFGGDGSYLLSNSTDLGKEGWRRMVKVCLREAKLSKEDTERLKNKRGNLALAKVIEELDATADDE